MYSITESRFLKFRKDFLNIIWVFLFWRLSLILFQVLADKFVPLHSVDKFIGGGFKNYLLSPKIFAWANFDGEHYLNIAIFGYKNLEQAFFPVYPKIISLLSTFFAFDYFSILLSSTLIGLLISNLSFLIALVMIWDLIRIDYSKKIAVWTILSILLFPTSFYFGSLYSESLFFLFAVACFYFARKKRWFWASFFGCLASATRVFGFLLFLALLIEVWQEKIHFRSFFWILFIPLGLLSYMYYQLITIGDPIAFYHLQKIVGEQHQEGLTFLPQVYFRYINMLLTVDKSNPIYQTLILEFFTGILFFILPIYGFFMKMRLSYVFFALASFILPSIQGSFSSVPRYIIVFFPSFIAFSLLICKFPKVIRVLIMIVFYILLGIETTLFLKGYWVS